VSKILAIESSANTASVSVIQGDIMLGEITTNYKKTHSERLMPMVQQLFDMLEMQPGDIDYIAVSVGPGSFTGLRIGVSAAKGIAYAAGKPMVAVPTLEGLAYNLQGADGLICAILDARNNQVFGQIFRGAADIIPLCEPVAEPIDCFISRIKEFAEDGKIKGKEIIWMVGDAIDIHNETLKSAFGEKTRFAPAGNNRQRALSVALAARKRIGENLIESYETLKPFYLRQSQAERKKQLTIDD